MSQRTRSQRRFVILSEPIYRQVVAASLKLGTTPTEIVTAGCRLFCTYVLREIAPRRQPQTHTKRTPSQCELQQIVKLLASRFGSPHTK